MPGLLLLSGARLLGLGARLLGFGVQVWVPVKVTVKEWVKTA